MASLLRQIVAGPRVKHADTGLDLCYVTKNIIATSGPSQTYPQRAYRNPLDRLVAFLDAKHGDNWAIWEFRAEGTGYPDEAVYGRIRHFPWPDHHPPPFAVVPLIMGGMKSWLSAPEKKEGERVVVVHCKAGKGRSGTMACSYLISECGWSAEDALARFTERRMRPGFGAGVSIPSQLRWVSYVERWTKGGKKPYVDRQVEILEVHVWGLRNGVKVEVEGFAEEGKKIKVFHTFEKEERIVVEGGAPGGGGMVDFVQDIAGYGVKVEDEAGEVVEDADFEGIKQGITRATTTSNDKAPSRSSSLKDKGARAADKVMRKLSTKRSGSASSVAPSLVGKNGQKSKTIAIPDPSVASSSTSTATLPAKDESRSQSTASLQNAGGLTFADASEPGGQAVIFKPAKPIRVPNSDINISVERRNKAPGNIGLTMVTAVAHVWFNVFFEGNGPEQDGKPDESGVFDIDWDKMDGIKGSSQRGTRACDRVSVVWRVVGATSTQEEGGNKSGVVINEPTEDGSVPQMQAADWKGANTEDPAANKHLGLRVEDPASASISKASSVKSQEEGNGKPEGEADEVSLEGVKVSGPTGEAVLDEGPARAPETLGEPSTALGDTVRSHNPEVRNA